MAETPVVLRFSFAGSPALSKAPRSISLSCALPKPSFESADRLLGGFSGTGGVAA